MKFCGSTFTLKHIQVKLSVELSVTPGGMCGKALQFCDVLFGMFDWGK